MNYESKSIIAAATMAAAGAAIFLILPLLIGLLVDYRGLSEQQAGVLASTYFATYLLSSVSAYFWIHHVHWRGASVIAYLLMIITIFALFIRGTAKDTPAMANQSTKSVASTREHLLDVAEALFLDQGVDAVSLRAIVRAAGQKNQSALQYHFGNRDGLITALSNRRQQQLEARRAELLRKLLSDNINPGLREACAIQVRAPFLLCREQSTFRDILGLFGQQMLASDSDFLAAEADQDAPSLRQLWEITWRQLDHLPLELLVLRGENAQAAAQLALSRRAQLDRGGNRRDDQL